MADQGSVGNPSPPASAGIDTIALYDAFAATYDASFEARSLRRVYDSLAWSFVERLLPPAPGVIADMGCGTGRWVARCLALGHRVIGIEPAAAMQCILRERFAGRDFTLIASGIEDAMLPEETVDAVLAMGSLQYVQDPAAALRRMQGWLRPGRPLCVHVDGLVALTLELLRLGKTDEALARLEERRGLFSYGRHAARLHLFDGSGLCKLLVEAGMTNVETRGLLISPAAWGRERSEAALASDEHAFVALEQVLSRSPALTDAGKHILAWGRRPPP